ncbi:unnamed protein product [Peronospora destructor]|uniref:Uncharacterized protein n=1 Tax=Peronospora destructor TaxID=86335 RepID=A0AAV0UAY2_9STRA|nr:unnamed protein product [Peronospora destructor]
MSSPPHFDRHDATLPPRGQRYQDHPPTSTLVLRGLPRTVNDKMILCALQPLQPIQARTIYDKTTGKPRGLAYVDFDSVEKAMEAMRTFGLRPLILQNRHVHVNYTDTFCRDVVSSRPKDSIGGVRHENQYQGEPRQARPDWICDECNVTNFARRRSCFQCNVPKTSQTKEIPATTAYRAGHMCSHDDSHYGGETENGSSSLTAPSSYGALSRGGEKASRKCGAGLDSAWSVPPSQVLVVRMLPPDIEEGELHVVFAEFDGVQDIRLIRDCVTNLSRGFAFVEFRDIEAATEALNRSQGLTVQKTLAWIRPQNDQNSAAADVSALWDSAAAQVTPFIKEPKKMWPAPFETAGGSYAVDVASKSVLSLSLKKDKKKASGISLGIKSTAFTIGMKRKSADDIAKWLQRQREANEPKNEEPSTAPAQQQLYAAQRQVYRASTHLSALLAEVRFLRHPSGEGLGKHGTGITAPIEAASGRSATWQNVGQKLVRARYDADSV